MELDPEPLPFDDENANLISKAIMNQNKALVKDIISTMRPNSSTLYETDAEGRTPLHYCALVGNLQIFEIIEARVRSSLKAMLNEQDNYKYTPLHIKLSSLSLT